MNELQKAILKIYKFCQKHEECAYKKCPLYKENYGCIAEIPDNWQIQDLLLMDLSE